MSIKISTVSRAHLEQVTTLARMKLAHEAIIVGQGHAISIRHGAISTSSRGPLRLRLERAMRDEPIYAYTDE